MIFAQVAAVRNVINAKTVTTVPFVFADSPFDANAPRRETPSLYNENALLKTDAELATAQKTSFSLKNALLFGVRVSPPRLVDAKSPDYNDFNALSQRRFLGKISPFFDSAAGARALFSLFSLRSGVEIRARALFFRTIAL